MIPFALNRLPLAVRETLVLRIFGFLYVPLLGYVKPRVLHVNSQCVKIAIPLSRRTKNHLSSMYFGALMIGADTTAAYYATRQIQIRKRKVDFVFKAVNANFLKQPRGEVVFSCDQGALIDELLTRALETGERVEGELKVTATVPGLSEGAVAEVTMTLSMKSRE